MKNKIIIKYNFIAQVFILFAVDILFLMLLASIFGNEAKEISNLYQFGSKGLAISTMLQFLLNAVVIIFLKSLFFSGKLFKNMMTLWRTVFLLLSILVFNILFIIFFNWFPMNNVYAWTGFFLCFGGGFIISTSFMIIKTKLENKKYNELLSSYKDQHGMENDNE